MLNHIYLLGQREKEKSTKTFILHRFTWREREIVGHSKLDTILGSYHLVEREREREMKTDRRKMRN